jgi:hypothetical protein
VAEEASAAPKAARGGARLARALGPAAGLVAVALLFAVLTGAPERYLSAGTCASSSPRR